MKGKITSPPEKVRMGVQLMHQDGSSLYFKTVQEAYKAAIDIDIILICFLPAEIQTFGKWQAEYRKVCFGSGVQENKVTGIR